MHGARVQYKAADDPCHFVIVLASSSTTASPTTSTKKLVVTTARFSQQSAIASQLNLPSL